MNKALLIFAMLIPVGVMANETQEIYGVWKVLKIIDPVNGAEEEISEDVVFYFNGNNTITVESANLPGGKLDGHLIFDQEKRKIYLSSDFEKKDGKDYWFEGVLLVFYEDNGGRCYLKRKKDVQQVAGGDATR